MKQLIFTLVLSLVCSLEASRPAAVKGKSTSADWLALDSQLNEVWALRQANEALPDGDPKKIKGNVQDVLLCLAKSAGLKMAALLFQKTGADDDRVEAAGKVESNERSSSLVPASEFAKAPRDPDRNRDWEGFAYARMKGGIPPFFTTEKSEKMFGENGLKVTTQDLDIGCSACKQLLGANPVECTWCSKVIYCSAECQKKDSVEHQRRCTAEYDVKQNVTASAAAEEKDSKSQHMSFRHWTQVGSEDDQLRQVEVARFLSLLGAVSPREWQTPLWKGRVGLHIRILLGAVDLEEKFLKGAFGAGAADLEVLSWVRRVTDDCESNEPLKIVLTTLCKDISPAQRQGWFRDLVRDPRAKKNWWLLAPLLKYGANPFEKFNYPRSLAAGTMLHAKGISTPSPEAISLMLVLGLLLDEPDSEGVCPLYFYLYRYTLVDGMHKNTAKTLLQFGAKLDREAFAKWYEAYAASDKDFAARRKTNIKEWLDKECAEILKYDDAVRTFRGKMDEQWDQLSQIFKNQIFNSPEHGFEYGLFYQNQSPLKAVSEVDKKIKASEKKSGLLAIINDYVGLTLFSAQKEPWLAEAVEALDQRQRAAAALARSK